MNFVFPLRIHWQPCHDEKPRVNIACIAHLQRSFELRPSSATVLLLVLWDMRNLRPELLADGARKGREPTSSPSAAMGTFETVRLSLGTAGLANYGDQSPSILITR